MKVKKILLISVLCQNIALLASIFHSKIRKWWVRPAWQERKEKGDYEALVKALAEEDPEYFKKYLRMTPGDFVRLKSIVYPYLQKNPQGRKALSPGHRLAIGLRFLASGDSLTSIAFAFRIGISTCHKIVKEVCDALWEALQPIYLSQPSLLEWEQIEYGFQTKWNFPNCIGAVDGKHVQIQAPPRSGTLYYNYKGTFSTVLMAVVDADYKFVVVDIGSYGSNSDGVIWKNSAFGKDYDHGRIGIPNPKNPPNHNASLPHVMLGDEAFQLRTNFLRPYPGSQLNNQRRIFNYRLSRARRCSENAFGIMVARWRILKHPINMKPENVDRVVRACTVLHNYLMAERDSENSPYCPSGYADRILSTGEVLEGEWRSADADSNGLVRFEGTHSRNFSMDAERTRQAFVSYLCGDGAVPWQNDFSHVH